MSRTKQSKAVVSANTRTTRTGLINVVRGNSIIAHGEYPVKADKAQSKLVQAMLELNVRWGNFQKAPALQKEPYRINVDDNTAVYVTVITHPDNQCSVCGTWDKSIYCPACRGEVVSTDSVEADL